MHEGSISLSNAHERAKVIVYKEFERVQRGHHAVSLDDIKRILAAELKVASINFDYLAYDDNDPESEFVVEERVKALRQATLETPEGVLEAINYLKQRARLDTSYIREVNSYVKRESASRGITPEKFLETDEVKEPLEKSRLDRSTRWEMIGLLLALQSGEDPEDL